MRVGISQRVEYIKKYDEARDCLDHRWAEFLEKVEVDMVPIPNNMENIVEWLDSMKCDAYILTGGNDLSDVPNAKNASLERDRTEKQILKYSQSKAIPVLGVCRGFQMINLFLGGKLDRVHGHVGKRHPVRICFDQSNKFISSNVNSFHNWGIKRNNLAKQLVPCAFDSNDFIESARHEELNWLGIMWHPEREEAIQDLDVNIIRKLFNEGFV